MNTLFNSAYHGLPTARYTGSNYFHLFPEPGTVYFADKSVAVSPFDSSCAIIPKDFADTINPSDEIPNTSL